ncbi:heparinase II/III family protein [uncultured Amaricoccus sp.]|uniref:heparinase II/III family protein n=2 Tax=Amaricoccus TaxID=56999 RepID=UPI00262D6D5C|nr:heparinase II/III family protein [uncultured Amaricoccus sp.]
MPRSALTLKALGVRLSRSWRAWRNRLRARRARLGGPPGPVAALPGPILLGDADAGQKLVSGGWAPLGLDLRVAPASIWDIGLPEGPVGDRLEDLRQSCLWLDDLAALGSRQARLLAQGWTQDWIRHFGGGNGPGWTPERAGRRAKRWVAHSAMLTQGLDPTATDRFWRVLAMHQRYLDQAWPEAPAGLPRLRALAGLVWTGRVLPRAEQGLTLAHLGALADELIDGEGAVATRAPEDLAETVTLLIWTARLLEDGGQNAPRALLAAIARAVPVLRPLRLGDGTLARFHGGGPGAPDRLDQALAELRLSVQAKPRLAMGYARLTGGRVVVVMDGAAPPADDWALGAHAAALGFEMSVGRQPFVVNVGPGGQFGADWARLCRETAAQSTVEVDGRSLARIETRDLAARVLGPRLEDGPTLVSVRQAQDATGMWLLATQDGYAATHGLLHERRIFVEARGAEVRGEEILTVTDARARARHDRAAADGPVGFAARFHLHPAVRAELDPFRQVASLTPPSGEIWMFRVAGGALEIEDSVWFDPALAAPVPTKQMVVRAEVVEYLGQITWSFGRVGEAPPSSARPTATDSDPDTDL